MMVQLELPFDEKSGHCPVCNPSGDLQEDMFRSMCDRHFREVQLEPIDLKDAIGEKQHHYPLHTPFDKRF